VAMSWDRTHRKLMIIVISTSRERRTKRTSSKNPKVCAIFVAK